MPETVPAPAEPFVDPTNITFTGFELIQFWTPNPMPSVNIIQPTPVFGLQARIFAANCGPITGTRPPYVSIKPVAQFVSAPIGIPVIGHLEDIVTTPPGAAKLPGEVMV